MSLDESFGSDKEEEEVHLTLSVSIFVTSFVWHCLNLSKSKDFWFYFSLR